MTRDCFWRAQARATARGILFVVLASAMVQGAGVSQQPPAVAPLYDDVHDCIVDGIPNGFTVVGARAQWQVVADGPAASAAAGGAIDMIASIWERWHAALHVLPEDGRAQYRIFFAPRASVRRLAVARGFQEVVCGRPGETAIIVDADDDRLPQTLSHEIFHAFQHSSAAVPMARGSWWKEATALWASDVFAPLPSYVTSGVRHFLDHPEIPMDDESATTDRNHLYGAWLYVRWLDDFLHCRVPGSCAQFATDGIWPLLAETFRRIDTGVPATEAVRGAIEARAPAGTFDDTVAWFWADTLGQHTVPRVWGGPFATGTSWLAGGSGGEQTITIAPLAAAILRIKVTASPARVTVYAHGPAASRNVVHVLFGGQVRGVDHREYAGRGFVTDLCSGTSAGSTFGIWPGELPLSIVNTGTAPATWQIAVRITPTCTGIMPVR